VYSDFAEKLLKHFLSTKTKANHLHCGEFIVFGGFLFYSKSPIYLRRILSGKDFVWRKFCP